MVRQNRFKVAGKDVVERIARLISQGDVRRICLIDEERSLLEIPIATGDPASPATMLEAPVLAAIKAFATLINDCTIEVETVDQAPKEEN